jgi:cytochrome c oxidase subunit 1
MCHDMQPIGPERTASSYPGSETPNVLARESSPHNEGIATQMISAAVEEQEHYLTSGYDLKSWLLSKDHKRIAVLYLVSTFVFFMLGGVLGGLMRMELLRPQGGIASPETYNKLFTMHGVIMVFFFLLPSIPATLGNFFLPIMIGARGLAFPRINLLSWYLLILGAGFAVFAMVAGGVDTGWALNAPYSTTYSNSYVAATVLGIFIAILSSMLTGVNFVATVHRMRAPGMTWSRMPLFVWANYITGVVQVVASPVIATALVLLLCERMLHLGIFDPAPGGNPVLFQRLFWFYVSSAVYVMVLPAMGVVSELVSTFSRKPVFGFRLVIFSSVAIAVLGFLGWGQHLFVSGQSTYASLVFSFLTFLVAIPAAITIFNWIATLYKGSISCAAPMQYAFAFVILFTIGGLATLFLAGLAMSVHVADTYFVTAQFHYLMVGGVVTAYLGGLHYWWPKMTGRMYPERWARVSAVAIFIGVNLTFFPQFILGYLGMPGRYPVYPAEFQILHVASTLGGSVLALGCILPAIYLIWSLRFGSVACANPWRAAGLEWKTGSPPSTCNFEEIPTIVNEAYDYSAVTRGLIGS